MWKSEKRAQQLNKDVMTTITNFTIECDEKPFVQVLIASKNNNTNTLETNSAARVPVCVKRSDLYGNEYKDEINIAPYIAKFVEKNHTNVNMFPNQPSAALQYVSTAQSHHEIHIDDEGSRPNFLVTVRFTYQRLRHPTGYNPASFTQMWYVDKIMSCEKR